MQHQLERFKHIHARKEQSHHADGGKSHEDRPGAPHDHEFGDKAVQPRQSQGSHGYQQQDRAIHRQDGEQSAEVFQNTRMGSVVQNAHQKEHPGRVNPWLNICSTAPLTAIVALCRNAVMVIRPHTPQQLSPAPRIPCG